uniref:Uncharacterized protein n=1 Tax=Glossina austeni TaxID=7395 RepID=A0A1A9V3H2_GLOAU
MTTTTASQQRRIRSSSRDVQYGNLYGWNISSVFWRLYARVYANAAKEEASTYTYNYSMVLQKAHTFIICLSLSLSLSRFTSSGGDSVSSTSSSLSYSGLKMSYAELTNNNADNIRIQFLLYFISVLNIATAAYIFQ